MTEAFVPTNPRSLTKRCAVRFHTQWMTSTAAVISVYGHIDGSNARTLPEYAFREGMSCRELILDLHRLKFFGTEGFPALHRISVRCAHAGIGWMLVPGAAVSRLLRICDPDGSLPAADTVSMAMANLRAQSCFPEPTTAFADRQ